jgi:hypothetical protein
MAPKVDMRKRKEARQKKVLLLLAPLLVILLVIQGPKLMKSMKGSTGTTEPQAAETSSAPTDSSTPATDPATVPVAPAAAQAPGILIDTDIPPEPDEGQLVAFGRFTGKDPFRQLVEDKESPGTEPGGGGSGGDEGPGDQGGAEPGDDEAPNRADLTVNGAAESVAVGGSFPSADPIFRLASIDGEIAKIGLVTGSFSTGVATLDLKVGETLTLVSQPDGVRYKIKLLGVSVGDTSTDSTPAVIPETTPDETPDAGSDEAPGSGSDATPDAGSDSPSSSG